MRASISSLSAFLRIGFFAAMLAMSPAAFVLFAERPATTRSAFEPAAVGKLAFSRLNFFTSGSFASPLHSVNSDGTGEVTIASATIPPVLNGAPAWSPDGTKLVYFSDGELWSMNADGSGKLNLTNTFGITENNPTWSSGGKIAYEREGQIWTMNSDGSGQSLFTFITQSFPASPSWSPDGSTLAFTTVDDIWVIGIDGSNERRVTNNSVPDTDPAWSPDGSKIIFGKGGTGIAVIDQDGTNEIALTDNAQDGKPSWSNDGTKIAFVRRGTSQNGIYTMDAVGGNQLRIVVDVPNQPGRSETNDPAWQPVTVTPNTSIISGRITRNGESMSGVLVNLTGSANMEAMTNSLGEYRFEGLAQNGTYTITPSLANHLFTPARRFVVNPTSNRIADFTAGQTCSTPGCRVNGKLVFVRGTDIFISNADGTGVTNLTNGAMGICEDPAYSPDGNFIVFRSNAPGNYEIYRMTSSGSNVTRLTDVAGTDEYPVYSPGGAKIAFVSSRDGNQEIYTMNVDGSNQQRLTNNTIRDGEPAFSPDGSRIVFNRGVNGNFGPWQLFTMNSVDGSNPLQITSPAVNFLDMTPSYSPDGTKIIFTRYDTGPFTSVFMTVNADGSGPATLPLSGFIRKASYSPDGTKIIFTRVGLGGFPNRLEVYPLAGGSSQTIVDGYNADWQPVRPAVRPTRFDFDGDGLSDVSVFRPSDGIWYILRSSDLGVTQTAFALNGDLPVPSDFDGDAKTDIAIYRPSNGDFWSLNTINSQQVNVRLGQPGDIAMPSDIDGDGRTDYVVYRPSNSHWYRIGAATGATSDIWFGTAGDKPVIGDFNGDGIADPAVYRPSDGNWWWLSSADGIQRATRWGVAEDTPTPADFDGDGKTDFAVFRPSTGVWYIINSGTGSFTIFPFGLSGDKPVPADYDGDGRADVAVYRPSDGTWYILRSTDGFTGFRWGIASDIPAPNAFIR